MNSFLASHNLNTGDILDENYGKLLQLVQPKTIETEQEYARFVTLLETLLEQEDEKSLSEQEILLLKLLVVLVQDYENQQIGISTSNLSASNLSASNPLKLLLSLMNAKALKQSDLVGVMGSSAMVSEIIDGKRNITQAQAYSLGELFNVPYKLFL